MTITYYEYASRDARKIALTFDDGPNPPRTDQVMEVLAPKNIRATFFLLGQWVERWPEATARLAQSHHVIGNHGYAHLKGICDFARAEAVIGNITGRETKFIRAPYFDCNSYNHLHPLMVKNTLRVHCDIYSDDFDAADPQSILDAVLNTSQVRGGSIILLHDGSENSDDYLRLARPTPMLEALPTLIDKLQERGFEFVGIDELEFHDPLIWEIHHTNT